MGSIGSIVAGWASAYQVVQAITLELQTQEELQNKAAGRGRRLGDAQAEIARSLFGQADYAQIQQVIEAVDRIAVENKLDRAIVLEEAKSTISATSGTLETRINETLQAFESLAPAFRGVEPELGDFAGVFLDFARQAKRTGMSMDEIRDLLLVTRSQIRVTDLEGLKNIVPALAAADISVKGGLSRKDQAAFIAFFASLGQRISDPTGELTRTATANLATVMKQFFPNIQEGEDVLFRRFQALTQLSEKQADAFFKALLGRGAVKPAVLGIATGQDPAGAASFADTLKAIENTDPRKVRDSLRFLETGTPQIRGNIAETAAANLAQELNQGREDLGRLRKILLEGDEETAGLAKLAEPDVFGAQTAGRLRRLISRLTEGEDVALAKEFAILEQRARSGSSQFPDPERAIQVLEEIRNGIDLLRPNNRNTPQPVEVP